MHTIYKITVGDKFYYGYTSRNATERLQEHLNNAKGIYTHRSLLYPALKRNNFKYEFMVLQTYQTEADALLREINEITNCPIDKKLNLTPGGEGRTICIKTRTVAGKLEYKIVAKKSKSSTPKRIVKRIKRRSTRRRRYNRRI